MAINGQFSWPSVGSSVAAYGQLLMSADKYPVIDILTRLAVVGPAIR